MGGGYFKHLGPGLKITESGKPIQTTVAYSMHNFMRAKSGAQFRVAGAFVDGHRVGSLTGGTIVRFDQEIIKMLGMFNYEYAAIAAYATADVLTNVLRRAVDKAPFWLSPAESKGISPAHYRSMAEGLHLRESGVVTYGDPAGNPFVLAGMHESVLQGTGGSGSQSLVTSADVEKFYVRGDRLGAQVRKNRSGRGISLSVSFHRVSPKGFDVAMWTHENLALAGHFSVQGAQPKYLEAAFDETDVQGDMIRIMTRDFASYYKAHNSGARLDRQATSLINSKLRGAILGKGAR